MQYCNDRHGCTVVIREESIPAFYPEFYQDIPNKQWKHRNIKELTKISVIKY